MIHAALNRLAQETSPYLLQHRENPVDWHPWGPEALARARAENKPILLSVGYSACHWCHVMAHECFENVEIARLMNERFVCIKVDREERPDLDQVYQPVAQAFTGGGGWPLTVFLTPELKPYYGGTYFPPDDRYGRPAFPKILVALADAYANDAAGIMARAEQVSEMLRGAEAFDAAKAPLTARTLDEAAAWACGHLDWGNGGSQGAPKFPNAMTYSFLWRHGTTEGRRAVVLTLEKMARGGIYDQLGGGFHRYAVDATWSVPHFEKMLYDNGLLLKLYAEALLSAEPLRAPTRALFARVLEQTVEYLLREMRSPEGAFYAAQDADSEGVEGKFFVWTPAELREALTTEEAAAFSRAYGVTEAGNFERGATVLFAAQEPAASERGLVEGAARKLLAVRAQRVPPGRDDKVLASWNGLAISGLSWAAKALRKEGNSETAARAERAAREAFRFVVERVGERGGRLHATYQGTAAKGNAYLDDYAFLAMAALDLARTLDDERGCVAAFERARAWVEVILVHFSDPEAPGFFFTSDDHEALIHRPRSVFDQAIPSGTAVAIECLLALAEADAGGNGETYQKEADRQLAGFSGLAQRASHGLHGLLAAAWLAARGPSVYSGPETSALCTDADRFRKPADPAASNERLVCHRRSCRKL